MTNQDVTVAIVEAIAEVEGREPHRLGYSLGTHVDTDAVERLAAMDNREWTLTFSVPDHEITVTGDGTITLDGEVVRELDADLSSEQH
ncbi:HalOD1 output domain-containing protein [Haloarcula pelagica]|uniref:HalOD1 output domain-containing protein n=1 Tax=Haloarcula pelagica TaxID=3033389 RepID=UPI0024C31ED9|nr:HalOD1 output domain-containing protein [Halomicroarcula sp. YJ-61-S]